MSCAVAELARIRVIWMVVGEVATSVRRSALVGIVAAGNASVLPAIIIATVVVASLTLTTSAPTSTLTRLGKKSLLTVIVN